MANVRSFTEILDEAPAAGAYLSGDEKRQLYEAQAPFFIVHASPCVDTTYGPQTQFSVKLKGQSEVRNLAFSHNGYRQAIAEGVVKAITGGMEAIGPCYLHKFATSKGNDAWSIADKKLDTLPAATAGVKATDGADDGLPF